MSSAAEARISKQASADFPTPSSLLSPHMSTPRGVPITDLFTPSDRLRLNSFLIPLSRWMIALIDLVDFAPTETILAKKSYFFPLARLDESGRLAAGLILHGASGLKKGRSSHRVLEFVLLKLRICSWLSLQNIPSWTSGLRASIGHEPLSSFC